MAIRVSLDGTLLVNTPEGWDKAKIKSKRDNAIKGLFVEYTTDLIFWGDGFDYIDSVLNDSYCNTITVLIETDDCEEGTWVIEFNGIIQLTKITAYNVQQRTIKTKILDESFDAQINNNKSLKAFVDVGSSKNNVTITPVTPVNIGFFLPTANFGTFIGTTRECYRVYDCFAFIIDYMTDSGVSFESDIFSTDYYDWMLCNGKEVRVGNGGGLQLEVSFKNLFKELDKKTNLSFSIEPSTSGYDNGFKLRLEPTSFFEEDDAILTLDNVLDIIMTFDKDNLYSHVDIGSDGYNDSVDLSYPPINFKTFKEENYTILGNCNVDKGLDLVSNYIIDTNVIELILTTGAADTKYDKETFLVITDGTNCIKYKEYDEPTSQGVDDGGVANRLTDSTADFNADGVLAGMMAVNMTTDVSTNIVSVDAGGTFCTLTDDIFTATDGYQVRSKPFSYNDPLTNVNVIQRFLGGLPNSVAKQYAISVTSNFYAGTTSNYVYSAFPTTIAAVPYDDDTTSPFFDDGANYDAIANYDYTVPSSGLYGFEAKGIFRFNGQLGNELLTNGDFSAGGTDWVINPFFGATFTNNRFNLSSPSTAAESLRQNETLSAGSIYVLTFDCTITTGIIKIGGQEITTTGTHTVILDYSNDTFAPLFIKFLFGGATALLTIDNVSLKETPRFGVTQNIIRKSAGGVTLQTFTDSYSIPLQYQQYQFDRILTSSETFSTFSGETISIKTTITNSAGNSTSATLLFELLDQATQLTDLTTFKTVSVDDGGGDLLPVGDTTFPIYEYKFEKSITFSDFKALKDAPEKAVLFSKNNANHIFGWRNSIEYDREKGTCSFVLRSKTKINGDC